MAGWIINLDPVAVPEPTTPSVTAQQVLSGTDPMRTPSDHYLAAIDALGVGDSRGDFMALGYGLTLGQAFPYPQGGYLLRRRSLYAAAGTDWVYCGYAQPEATQILSNQSVTHPGDVFELLTLLHEMRIGLRWPFSLRRSVRAYQYAAARVLGSGIISAWSEPVRVDFDAEGFLISPGLPMPPLNVAALPMAAGRFRIYFEYNPFGQGAAPLGFQVFRGAAAGSVDYLNALADPTTGLNWVPYDARLRRLTFVTPSYADATPCVFTVRGVNANWIREENTATTGVEKARATAPPAARLTEVIPRR